jgi:hypothetical protein
MHGRKFTELAPQFQEHRGTAPVPMQGTQPKQKLPKAAARRLSLPSKRQRSFVVQRNSETQQVAAAEYQAQAGKCSDGCHELPVQLKLLIGTLSLPRCL